MGGLISIITVPGRPDCREKYFWKFMIWRRCKPQDKKPNDASKPPPKVEQPPKGQPPKDDKADKISEVFTLVRLTIGSHESVSMGGSVPNFAVFDEFGARLGSTMTKSDSSAPGSFKDIEVTHKKGLETVKPSYLLIQGGENAICISSVALKYADGTQQSITGDDLAGCDRLETSKSRGFVGPGNNQPRCFWLQDSKTGKKSYQRVSFHLPDLVWTNLRREAYRNTPELLCRNTPRFWSKEIKEHGDPQAILKPIVIFNPLVEYDQNDMDKYPAKILKWKMGERNMKDFSDRPFEPRKAVNMRSLKPGAELEPSSNISASQFLEKGFTSFIETRIEEERVRTQAPILIVSNETVSAQEQCRRGSWNHTDYVSLSEKIYCDMQSRSMFWTCDDTRKANCWNLETGMLQKDQTGESYQPLNLTTAAQNWSASGPLYGFAYSNFNLIG